jgi:hypothetical protein
MICRVCRVLEYDIPATPWISSSGLYFFSQTIFCRPKEGPPSLLGSKQVISRQDGLAIFLRFYILKL